MGAHFLLWGSPLCSVGYNVRHVHLVHYQMYMWSSTRCACRAVRDVHLVLHDMHISYIVPLWLLICLIIASIPEVLVESNLMNHIL